MATRVFVPVMAVIMSVLMGMAGLQVRVFMAIMGVRHVFVGMLVLMLVLAVAAHLRSPPSRWGL